MSIETNCFRINGLDALNTTYRMYQIAGLRRDSSDYYSNLQRLIRQLSFQMRAPVATYDREGETFLVIPPEFGDPPAPVMLVGAVVVLKDTGETIDLDFTVANPDLDPVRLRFLQFIFQGSLFRDSRLWQPSAGKAFFFKKPAEQFGAIDLYEGFAIRVVSHPEDGFGLVVDLRRKLVSRSSLSIFSTREQINALKGRSCLYKMGHMWFEVTLDGLADLSIGKPSIPLEGEAVSLIEYLHRKSRKPVSPSIANLSPDGAAIYYRTNGPDQRSAPAALCHLVEDTHSQEGARYQHETVIKPYDRHRQINRLVKMFLRQVTIGDITLSVSNQAGRTRTKPFLPPNLRFGNDVTLSLGEKERIAVAINDYGQSRLTFLKDENAGFFDQSLLDQQYLVLPKSVENSYGSQFLKDLKKQVDDLYPNGGGYDPEIIVYNDLNIRRDFVGQSHAIREAVESTDVRPGYALVMVHRYDRRPRSADQLVAWTVKEFPDMFGLNVAVIHTEMAKKAYGSMTRGDVTRYIVKDSERGRFSGYLRNVALNKILLTNCKWPFILDTPLYADVTIGIDVKNNTAAFTLIANGGKIIRLSTSSSRQKEQLLKAQVAQFVIDLISQEGSHFESRPRQIVIHRDGRTWSVEIEGLKEACRQLAKDGYLDPGWQLTVVEIAKSAPAPLRLFNVKPSNRGQGIYVENPMVGNWIQTAPNEGYVCTTGRPFRIPGTSNPLHIRRADGNMSIEHCLSDIFSLSCLTWTRPEGATRLPISIKLCDRSLFDEAAEYDQDAVEFGSTHLQEEVAT